MSSSRLKIYRRGLDSLEIGIYPQDKRRFQKFINEFILPKFGEKKSGWIELFGFDLYGNNGPSRRGNHPIQLIGKDTIEVFLAKTYPKSMEPISLKLTQPFIWIDPVLRAEEIIKKLEHHVGPTMNIVKRADISVHFSGWTIDTNEFFNNLQSEKAEPSKKGKDPTKWIRVGDLKSELPQMNSYNKSKDLKANPRKPDPRHVYNIRPDFGKDIYNIEFAWTQKSLERFSVRSLREFARAVPDLWNFCTNDFVYVVDINGEIAPEWIALSKVFTEKNRNLFTRRSKKKQDPNLLYRYDLAAKDLRSIMKLEKGKSKEEIWERLKVYL